MYIYIYMVFCIFNGIFYSMKNEYQQFHINIFIKEGKITGIIGLLEYFICSFHVYIYIGFLHPPWITVSNKEWTFNVSIWISVISLNFIFYLWNQIRIASSKQMMLSIYIFVYFSFLNGLQKSTDRIFRLAVPALLAASGHIL